MTDIISFKFYFIFTINIKISQKMMTAENARMSAVAFGEGWHNYYQTFPWDYRAVELGQRLSLTMWLIDLLARKDWLCSMKMATPDVVRSRATKRMDGTHPTVAQRRRRSRRRRRRRKIRFHQAEKSKAHVDRSPGKILVAYEWKSLHYREYNTTASLFCREKNINLIL